MKTNLLGGNCSSRVAPMGEEAGTERRVARLTESFPLGRTNPQGKWHQRTLPFPLSVTASEEWRLSLPPKNVRVCVQAKLTGT